jgi:hypothetical protein
LFGEQNGDSYGDDHHQLAESLIGLGRVDAAEGVHESAIGHFERALTVREQALGSHHPLLPEVLEPYAGSLRAAGRTADVDAALEQVKRIRQ